MALSDKLRKAAKLFVTMDESSSAPRESAEPAYNFSQATTTTPTTTDTAGSSAASMSEDDLEKRLAAMNSAIQSINTGTNAVQEVSAPAAAAVSSSGGSVGSGTGAVRTIDELLRETEGPNLNEIKTEAQDAQSALTEAGKLDFPALYQAASLPTTPFSAEQMLDMLASMPANMPLDMKRQTIQVTVGALGKSIGATPETIVADASRKLAALAAYDADFSKRTEEFAAGAEAEITALLAQVEEKRKAILEARQKQSEVRHQCEVEADRLDDVLEFFSLDVGASKYAPAGAAGATATTPPPLPTA